MSSSYPHALLFPPSAPYAANPSLPPPPPEVEPFYAFQMNTFRHLIIQSQQGKDGFVIACSLTAIITVFRGLAPRESQLLVTLYWATTPLTRILRIDPL